MQVHKRKDAGRLRRELAVELVAFDSDATGPVLVEAIYDQVRLGYYVRAVYDRKVSGFFSVKTPDFGPFSTEDRALVGMNKLLQGLHKEARRQV